MILKRVIAGIIGAEVGLLFFGFFALAPLHTIKTVILLGAGVFGVLVFIAGAISLVRGGDDD